MKRVTVSVPVGCFHRNALVAKIQDDVLPFSGCTGVEVVCNGVLRVKAMCPSNEGTLFRKMIRTVARRPLLAGKKRRR